ncbi:hypothetical protein DICVIV_00218 [Dictyocaulus viviparus]|uniref:AATF leucine zipper-containing domain-containing protein n=1 Tax=Dictyocaulus viviparus TaxID=29172 RepID=A0A0D8YB94_DICVI|nr:hypothetical protein DICVIV_00218 [Dictyocaulus viviparus]
MSLLKDIEKLMKPVCDLPDLEDDDVDGTASSSILRYKNDANDCTLKPRKKVIDLSVDNTSKYGGVKISRNDIFDHCDVLGFADNFIRRKARNCETNVANDGNDSHDIVSNESLSRNSNDKTEADDEASEKEEDRQDCIDGEVQSFDSQDDSDSSVDKAIGDFNGSENEDNDQGLHHPTTENSAFTNVFVNNVDQDKQQKKAKAVHEQIRIWEQLLYVMIKVHAGLRAFNQLPRGQHAKDLLKNADRRTANNLAQAYRNSNKLASMLLEAEQFLLRLSSHTKSIVGATSTRDTDDEEIESSDDEGEGSYDALNDENSDVEEKEERVGTKTKPSYIRPKSLCRYSEKAEQQFMKFRESTLMKWDERTSFITSRGIRRANSDFSAFEKNNVVAQIEQICANKDWLLKRSRTKKSDIERIGGYRRLRKTRKFTMMTTSMKLF